MPPKIIRRRWRELYSLIIHNLTISWMLTTDSTANYLRAWMFEAQIRDRLINDYGEGWFGKKEAGIQLQKWWSLGQKYSVEEILRELGYKGLDPGPLLNEIERNLN